MTGPPGISLVCPLYTNQEMCLGLNESNVSINHFWWHLYGVHNNDKTAIIKTPLRVVIQYQHRHWVKWVFCFPEWYLRIPDLQWQPKYHTHEKWQCYLWLEGSKVVGCGRNKEMGHDRRALLEGGGGGVSGWLGSLSIDTSLSAVISTEGV